MRGALLSRRGSVRGSAAGAPPPFSPTSIAGLQFWYTPDSLGLANADPVASWADSSGNGRTASQATSGSRPTFRTNVVNGKSVVRFDGTDDWLKAANITAIAQPTTFFIVYKVATLGGFQNGFDASNAASHIFRAEHAGNIAMYAGSVLTGPTSNTSWAVVIGVFNGASSKLWRGGGAATTGDPGAGSCNSFVLGGADGGSTPLNGDIRHAGLYTGQLSLTDVNSLGDYLAADVGLTWTAAS